SRRRHTRSDRDWSSDVCSSDLRIAGVNEMTSSSALGSSRITLQFDLNRDIDGAARDVQAALNAARSLLPTGLPSNPTYRKVNPRSEERRVGKEWRSGWAP